MPQNVAGNRGLSSPGAVWRILKIQGLALLHGGAAPCREPFLIGNLPKRLFSRFSVRVAPARGRCVTLPAPCARDEERWHVQSSPPCILLDGRDGHVFLHSPGETGVSDIPPEPTLPEERCAQRMSRARSGNGATRSRTQRQRSEYGEHGEYPPLDIASTLLAFMSAPGEVD